MPQNDPMPLTPRLKKSPYLLRTAQSRASAVAVVCSLATAMLVLGQPSPRSGVTASEVQPQAPAGPAQATSAAASTIALQDPSAITITGCLEQDDDRFRLRDTAGVDAPRSRSWKSAFLKKGAAAIEVMDAANRFQLTNHVGRRVRVTGTLADGEMQVSSLRRVATSCKDKPA
jgi:hypothetical protein